MQDGTQEHVGESTAAVMQDSAEAPVQESAEDPKGESIDEAAVQDSAQGAKGESMAANLSQNVASLREAAMRMRSQIPGWSHNNASRLAPRRGPTLRPSTGDTTKPSLGGAAQASHTKPGPLPAPGAVRHVAWGRGTGGAGSLVQHLREAGAAAGGVLGQARTPSLDVASPERFMVLGKVRSPSAKVAAVVSTVHEICAPVEG